jgi:hypothetical protein
VVKENMQDIPRQANELQEGTSVYETREALEDARLREAINRTDTEKFKLFTTMFRISKMMQRATIHHSK